MGSLKNDLVKLVQKIVRDDCPGLAGEMAYNMILSLIPALIFFTSLSGLVGRQRQVYPLVLDFINRFAPAYTNDMLTGTIDAVIRGSSAGLTFIGFMGSLWSASSGGHVIIKGLQRAYGLSGRKFPFWYNHWLSIVILLSLGLLLMLATDLIVFGNLLITWLLRHGWIDTNLPHGCKGCAGWWSLSAFMEEPLLLIRLSYIPKRGVWPGENLCRAHVFLSLLGSWFPTCLASMWSIYTSSTRFTGHWER